MTLIQILAIILYTLINCTWHTEFSILVRFSSQKVRTVQPKFTCGFLRCDLSSYRFHKMLTDLGTVNIETVLYSFDHSYEQL